MYVSFETPHNEQLLSTFQEITASSKAFDPDMPVVEDKIKEANGLDPELQYQWPLYSPLEPKIQQHFERYVQMCKQAVDNEGVQRKYILVRPTGQLGNRIRNVVSGLLIGLLTDRVLVAQFKRGYFAKLTDLFELPYTMDIEELPYYIKQEVRHGSKKRLGNICGGRQVVCDRFSQWSETVVELEGACYISRLIYQNTNMQEVIKERLGRFTGGFSRLMKFFLPLHPSVRSEVERILANVFQGKYVVGMHIRAGNDFNVEGQTDEDMFRYFLCSDLIKPQSHLKNMLYFVATDSLKNRNRILRLTTGAYNVTFYGEFHISNTLEGVRAALVDLSLLMAARLRILTTGSSFSEIAGAMAVSESTNLYSIEKRRRDKKFPFKEGYPIDDEHTLCWSPGALEPSILEFDELVNVRC